MWDAPNACIKLNEATGNEIEWWYAMNLIMNEYTWKCSLLDTRHAQISSKNEWNSDVKM